MKMAIAATLLIACASAATAASQDKPNIVVILTDDWGSGDLGLCGILPDVKTPHLDQLARDGVLFTDGYITAPQCAPSRAGLLTGRYQQRFGFGCIGLGPLPLEETTIADRLKQAGYTTGMVGKWHLEPTAPDLHWAVKNHPELVNGNKVISLPFAVLEPYFPHSRGFDEFYYRRTSPYYANFDLAGRDVSPPKWEKSNDFRVDVHTEAALAFLERNKQKPFFLYLAYFAPHVPLEAPQKYLDRFPGEMPERRRYALAMISAVDDGIGRIVEQLKRDGLDQKTLIFFASDNGAPLGAHMPGGVMEDARPATEGGPAWDGSRNDPFRGEKGMLSDGGIRVPFIAAWPGTIPAGQRFADPVITLDIAATANALAGLPDDPKLDGVNLLPYLTGKKSGAPHAEIYWKFWNQAAVRSGDWKFIQAGSRGQLLFNLKEDQEEHHNLIARYPEKAKELQRKLGNWADQMTPAGLPDGGGNDQEAKWYQYYFEQELK
ncbi:MAG: sulfatase-like hydrolase/transferase [Kiritimatiellales bacterium]|nr:sulfatase-like hydrolase/transferase [Kiritimatiellales bacterium]